MNPTKIQIDAEGNVAEKLNEAQKALLESVVGFQGMEKAGTSALTELERTMDKWSKTYQRELDAIQQGWARARLEMEKTRDASPTDTEKIKNAARAVNEYADKWEDVSAKMKETHKWYDMLSRGTPGGGGQPGQGGGQGGGKGGAGGVMAAVMPMMFSPMSATAGGGLGPLSGMFMAGGGMVARLGAKGGAVGGIAAVAGAAMAALGVMSALSETWERYKGIQGARLNAVGGIGAGGIMSGTRVGARYMFTQGQSPMIASSYAQAAGMGAGMEGAFAGMRGAGVDPGQMGGYVGALRQAGVFGTNQGKITGSQVNRMIGLGVQIGQAGGTIRPGEYSQLGQILTGLQTVVSSIGQQMTVGDQQMKDIAGVMAWTAQYGRDTGRATMTYNPSSIVSGFNQSIQSGMAGGGPYGQAFFYRSMLKANPAMAGMSGPEQMWELEKMKAGGFTLDKANAIMGRAHEMSAGMSPAVAKLMLKQNTGLGPEAIDALMEATTDKETGAFKPLEGLEGIDKTMGGKGWRDLQGEADKNAKAFGDVASIEMKMDALATEHAPKLVKWAEENVNLQRSALNVGTKISEKLFPFVDDAVKDLGEIIDIATGQKSLLEVLTATSLANTLGTAAAWTIPGAIGMKKELIEMFSLLVGKDAMVVGSGKRGKGISAADADEFLNRLDRHFAGGESPTYGAKQRGLYNER